MRCHRMTSAVIAALLLGLLGLVGDAEAEPQVVLLPPLPAPGQSVRLIVADPAPAFKNARVYLWLRGAGAPTLDLESDRTGNTETAFPTFLYRFGEAGSYIGEYYDEPFPRYDASPKATFEVTVSASGLATVVEYHHARLDRYFYATDADEIARLDTGATTGWTRTGESFGALPAGARATYALPVCRFLGVPEAGIDGHFFSASPSECATVLAKWPDRWHLETSEAFSAVAPPTPFTCEPDYWQRVYRLYDARFGPRHRYTVSLAIRDRMRADGWIVEGAPLDGPYDESYAMCVPK